MRVVLIINIFTSVVVFSVGVYFIFMPLKIDSTTKILFGAIFIAYGIYRFLNVLNKQKLLRQNEKIEEMRIAQDKLIEDVKVNKEKNEK